MPQYELNLSDYGRIIRKRKWIIIIVFSVCFISTWWWSNQQAPVYEASADVRIIEYKTFGGLLTELVSWTSGDPIETQARVITSQPIMERVVKKLALVREGATEGEIARAARSLRGRVSTERLSRTNIIRITVTSDNPFQAAEMANKVAEVYKEEVFTEKNQETLDSYNEIKTQREEVARELKETEEKLTEFKELHGMIEKLASLKSDLSALLKKFTEKHPDVIRQREEIQVTFDQLVEELKARKIGLKERGIIPPGELKKYEKEIELLPIVELEFVRLSRQKSLNENRYQDLEIKFYSASLALKKAPQYVIIDKPAVEPGAPLSPNKRLYRTIGALIGIMLGFTTALIREHLDTSIGTIEDVESYVKAPVLGVIPYLRTEEEKSNLSAKLSNIRGLIPYLKHKAEGAEEEFYQVVAQEGLIAYLKHEGKKIAIFRRVRHSGRAKVSQMRKQLIIHASPKSPSNEAYRTLRTNIQFMGLEKGGKTLLLTSAGPGEGKTITSLNLGITMAQMGNKTLVMCADLRRPLLHKLFGLKREPGLTNILVGTTDWQRSLRTLTDILMGDIDWEDALKVPGLDNLNIITSGPLPPNPSELLNSPEMERLIDELKEKFDIIIFDCPPVLPVTDASILGAKVDGVVLIYQVGKAARRALLRAKMQVENVGGKVKGIILNHLRPEIAPSGPYYYYHYKYYGTSEEEKEEEPAKA